MCWGIADTVKKISIILLLFIYPVLVQAKITNTNLPNKLAATAEFVQGAQDKPAVFLLHGFLQTHNSATLSRLFNHINGEGYTVLAPTLSLGINKRRQSLSCEAIHTHQMKSDIEEIDFWINWLTRKKYNDIILVGHSYGSLQVLIYMSEKSRKAVKKIVATSLVDFDHMLNINESAIQIRQAKMKLRNNDRSLSTYKISYCNKYVSPAKSYLSYAEWSKSDILKLIGSINVPLGIILGSKDKRIDVSWSKKLKKTSAQVILIEGANHFFDDEYEFDLMDEITELLSSYK